MLSEFKNRLLLSPSEKKDYDEFCQKIKNDPEFKNKKVSVKNWKEINIRYNDCVKTIQEELDKSKKDDYNMKPSIKKMIEDKITKFKDVAKNMTTSITIEELISKSKNDVNFAEGMDLLINNDIVKLDKIVTGVNQADATRLSKEIHKASHRTWFSQKLSELRYTFSSQKAIDARERRRTIKALRKGAIRGLKESDPEIKSTVEKTSEVQTPQQLIVVTGSEIQGLINKDGSIIEWLRLIGEFAVSFVKIAIDILGWALKIIISIVISITLFFFFH
jgi:hypothetical protein